MTGPSCSLIHNKYEHLDSNPGGNGAIGDSGLRSVLGIRHLVRGDRPVGSWFVRPIPSGDRPGWGGFVAIALGGNWAGRNDRIVVVLGRDWAGRDGGITLRRSVGGGRVGEVDIAFRRDRARRDV